MSRPFTTFRFPFNRRLSCARMSQEIALSIFGVRNPQEYQEYLAGEKRDADPAAIRPVLFAGLAKAAGLLGVSPEGLMQGKNNFAPLSKLTPLQVMAIVDAMYHADKAAGENRPAISWEDVQTYFSIFSPYLEVGGSQCDASMLKEAFEVSQDAQC